MGYQKVGELSTLGPDYNVLRDPVTERFAVCKDVDAFINATATAQYMHEIKRVIGRTVYLRRRGSHITYIKGMRKETEDMLSKAFPCDDENLLRAESLASGADLGDHETYRDVERILEWEEIQGIAPGLGFLGYPGRGVSYMVTESKDKSRALIIQQVDSYMEGYAVQSTLLPIDVVTALGTDQVRGVINRMLSGKSE